MFRKRLQELTSADIGKVVSEAWQEGAEVEFKETLPAKRGLDQWLIDQSQIGEYARNKFVAEVIAFANAHGGHLLLGIEESTERPARAIGVKPLPRCADLAERIRLQCRDCVEPQIPLLEVVGVPTEKNGSGVVVFRVPQSRLAPHRHAALRECFIRRGDRSEKMSMREIQDLTLQVERGLASIDRAFSRSRVNFNHLVRDLTVEEEFLVAHRATLVPLAQLYVERVHGDRSVLPPDDEFVATIEDNKYRLHGWHGLVHWRPVLRGTRGADVDDNGAFTREVYCDGRIEYTMWRKIRRMRELPVSFHPEEFVGFVCNALCAAELFRQAAGAPEVEYGLEVELHVLGGELGIAPYGARHTLRRLSPLPRGSTVFPRYSVGPREELPRVISLVEQDFWDAAGVETKDHPSIAVDFEAVLNKLERSAIR